MEVKSIGPIEVSSVFLVALDKLQILDKYEREMIICLSEFVWVGLSWPEWNLKDLLSI